MLCVVGEAWTVLGLGVGEGDFLGLAGPTLRSNILEASFPEESVATTFICWTPSCSEVNCHAFEQVFCRPHSKVPELDPERGFEDVHDSCFTPLSSSAVILSSKASPKEGFEGFKLVEEINGGLLYSSAEGSCAAYGLGSDFPVDAPLFSGDFKIDDGEPSCRGNFSGDAVVLIFSVLSVAHPLITMTRHSKAIKISFIFCYISSSCYLKSS